MGEVVELKPAPLVEDHEFVVDLARFRENLLDEKAIRKKYRFDEATWLALGDDDELIRKVEQESIRRVRDGSAKKERSQQLITKAPNILDSIMSDPAQSARHRVDAIKTLDGMAAPLAAAAAGQSDRFIISIILNSDDGSAPHTLHFDKSRTIDPHDVDRANDIDTTPWEMLAAKKTDGDDGQSL
jgi:hypothetical protein